MDGKYQTMDAVYDCSVISPEQQKIYFGLAKEKWEKGIITIKSHPNKQYSMRRQHFQVICGI